MSNKTTPQIKKDSCFEVVSFYQFVELKEERVGELESLFRSFAKKTAMKGLIITSQEGVNATICVHRESFDELKDLLNSTVELSKLELKIHSTKRQVFRRFSIKRRPEIVSLGRPDLFPDQHDSSHLSPVEWDRILREEKDYVLIDTRNRYETSVGKFQGAIDPEIDQFSDFARFVERFEVPSSTKVLMYCTGGIRCEKASLHMREKGFENVFQLQGGILKYLEQFPNSQFEGECFVFDHRVAVQQDLSASQRYGLCPHCGNPGDRVVDCRNCQKESSICSDCEATLSLQSCSKNCAYHLEHQAIKDADRSHAGSDKLRESSQE